MVGGMKQTEKRSERTVRGGQLGGQMVGDDCKESEGKWEGETYT